MKEKLVGVYPSLQALPAAFRSAFTQLLPVRFESAADGCDRGRLDAALVLAETAGNLLSPWPPGLRRFCVWPGEEPPLPKSDRAHTAQFSASQVLDGRLRNRTLPHQQLEPVHAVALQSGDAVLARLDGSPVWVSRAEPRQDIVSLPLPELKDGEQALDYLNDGNYLRLLPLLHFLREVAADAWQPPPLRACLMFDDPNLRWRSYGFLDYRRLAELARQSGLHVALATVPLDAWGAHRATVKLFKENPGQLSLLIHGNDHTREELGRARSPEDQLRLLAQALARISRFERSTGLRVARAIAPPHGACAKAGLAAMFALGFEGACISPWSLRHWAIQQDCPPAFGLQMAELMAGGFPVLPRFRLSESCEAKIAIAAFLDLPIIPVGHHHTVAGGFDLLARTADITASLGGVHWGSPEMILRSNFASRREDSTLLVRPYSARIRFQVPSGVTTLRIAPPGEVAFRVAAVEAGHASSSGHEPIPVHAGEELEVVAEGLGAVDYTQVGRPPSSWWPLPRRILTEVRDRLQPLVYSVRRRQRQSLGNWGGD
jgi:hypothetical protein